MSKKKLLLVLGTRPEAIKMAPLYKELKKSSVFEVRLLATAQHREMLDSVLLLFDIKPDFDLNIMKPGQDLTDITVKILEGCKDIFSAWTPDLILVHGDTTTSMAGAMAAFYNKIPVAHVEAGLRTYNIHSPYPEELNRQLTSRISTIHFCPTEISQMNLIKEGINKDSAPITGNTVIDALFEAVKIIDSKQISFSLPYDVNSKPFVLITGHRRENFGEGFQNICVAIRTLAEKYPEFDFVYPVHLNPNVQGPVNEFLSQNENIKLLPPLEYLPFVTLLRHSYLILTDSGGIQEEAPSLGKPVLVMREKTERPEAVESGTVILTGSNSDSIVKTVTELISNKSVYDKMVKQSNPYGDGKASEKIRNFLENYFKTKQ